MMTTLLEKFREWGKASDPRVAIVDWKGLPTQAGNLVMFAKLFEANGIPTVICSPDELTYRDKTLYANGQPVNVVYKRVLTSEFLDRYGQATALDHPFAQALSRWHDLPGEQFQSEATAQMIFGLLSDPSIMSAAGIDAADAIGLGEAHSVDAARAAITHDVSKSERGFAEVHA